MNVRKCDFENVDDIKKIFDKRRDRNVRYTRWVAAAGLLLGVMAGSKNATVTAAGFTGITGSYLQLQHNRKSHVTKNRSDLAKLQDSLEPYVSHDHTVYLGFSDSTIEKKLVWDERTAVADKRSTIKNRTLRAAESMAGVYAAMSTGLAEFTINSNVSVSRQMLLGTSAVVLAYSSNRQVENRIHHIDELTNTFAAQADNMLQQKVFGVQRT